MTDVDLNLLYEIGSLGCSVDEFNYPCGIFYNNANSFVYICDSQNTRIQVYNKNLVFERTYNLDFTPFEIKCLNGYAFMRDNDKKNIYCFNLSTFELITKYEGHNGTLFVLNSFIYEYFNENSTMYVYNNECSILKCFIINVPNNVIKFNGLESMCYFNGKFILANENSKKLCLL